MIGTIIVKPTKLCNADCGYCSSPPDGVSKWSIDQFKSVFDKLAPFLANRAFIIWHGGEPMLMGPDFYVQAYDYARSRKPDIRFSIQTNLLLYDSARWAHVIRDIMGGSISTSYDPDLRYRTLNGNPIAYRNRFFRKVDALIADGFRPMVIGTYDEASIGMAMDVYDMAKARKENWFDIRVNYRYPAGRVFGAKELISPESYGRALVSIYDRWINETPPFNVTPLDQMLLKTVRAEYDRCPWTKACGGRMIGIEPNGDVYNCADFADVGTEFRFGNIFTDSVEKILSSNQARLIRRRQFLLPNECQSCEHFEQCEGGCARDSVLFGNGLHGKFHYCASWKMVFSRIKESISTGEARSILARYGIKA